MSDDRPNPSPEQSQAPRSLQQACGTSAGPHDRSSQVRLRLVEIGRAYQQSTIEVATLLEEVHRNGYWQDSHTTFSRYVEDEVGISLRTAQELLRVIRSCQSVGVSAEDIARLGWSKVAVIARHLTPQNAAQLLRHVEATPYSDLKKQAKVMQRQQQPSASELSESRDRICVTHAIQRALRLASMHTHDPDIQANLEFIAKKFTELCPVPSRVRFRASLN
jgi:hypothetical protein